MMKMSIIITLIRWYRCGFGNALRFILIIVGIPVIIAVILEATIKNDYNFYFLIPAMSLFVFSVVVDFIRE